jgi:hypothetical protein
LLVNARMQYILVDGLHYSLGGQGIVTVNPLALLHIVTDQELHLSTETEQDQARLPLLQYNQSASKIEPRFKNRQKRLKGNHHGSSI